MKHLLKYNLSIGFFLMLVIVCIFGSKQDSKVIYAATTTLNMSTAVKRCVDFNIKRMERENSPLIKEPAAKAYYLNEYTKVCPEFVQCFVDFDSEQSLKTIPPRHSHTGNGRPGISWNPEAKEQSTLCSCASGWVEQNGLCARSETQTSETQSGEKEKQSEQSQKLFIEPAAKKESGCLNSAAKVRFIKSPGLQSNLNTTFVPEMTLEPGDILRIPLPAQDWVVVAEYAYKSGGRPGRIVAIGGTTVKIPCYKETGASNVLLWLAEGVINFVTTESRQKPTAYTVEAQNTVIAIEGTELVIDSTKKQDNIYVIDGKVSIRPKLNQNITSTQVIAGQSVTTTVSSISSPQLARAIDLIQRYPTLFTEKKAVDFLVNDTITKLKTNLSSTKGVWWAVINYQILIGGVIILVVIITILFIIVRRKQVLIK